MEDQLIRHVVILGGGSAGWMTAAALAKSIQRDCDITLIESEEIGTIGVGEATIPPIRQFNDMLGIAEDDFLRRTKGSFKLGIRFVDWGLQGHSYFHPFGSYGRPFDLVQIQHWWQRARTQGRAQAMDEYCMAWAAAKQGRFDHPSPDPRHVLSTYDYAYHFDAGLYARYLREYAQARRVRRIEGKVRSVRQNAETGFVERLLMENGDEIAGELVIDCSGLRAVLIEGALKTGFDDWTCWLPCDRALTVPSETVHFAPYTQSTAHMAGWQWRIPLQHRTGNGHVYSSAFMDDEQAQRVLMSHLDGEPRAAPRLIKFTAGRRKLCWNRNVIAIGLSAGFLEPLESTSLHLVQAGISKLLAYFPDRGFDPLVIREFNRVAAAEVERIRDFIILHYHLTTRTDGELWQYCAHMPIPDTLQYKIDHFKHFGRLIPGDMDLFGNTSWLAVHIGQMNWPERNDPLANYREADGAGYLERLRLAMAQAAQGMPTHRAYVERHCATVIDCKQ